MIRPSLAFRAAFASAVLAAFAAACGSSDRGAFTDDTTDAGTVTKKKDASTPPPPPDDVNAPDPDAADVFVWPDCNTQPASAATKTIPQVWQADPTTETETWISGAYVTAISGGACVANKACQIFLQADTSYATLAGAAQHAIKMFVSSAVANHFTTIAVGDRVDALGWAWRYNLDAQHELLLQVNAKLPGCLKTTSSGNTLTPIPGVFLSDLTLDKYENTHGPLFVKVANVSGKPDASATTTFGLWTTTDGGFFDAGSDAGADIVSLSPYFLPGSAFTGLTAGANTKFASITGVFGLFVPAGGPKYLEIYPRTTADIVLQ